MNDFAIGFDELHFFQGFIERHRSHFTGFEANHATELTFSDKIGGGHTKASPEDAVEGRGRAAALNVTQNSDAKLFAQHFAKDIGDDVGDSTRTDRGNGLALGIHSGELDAFSDYDEAEVLAAEFASADGVANGFKTEGNFGNEDDVGATGDPGVESDPAGVTAHDFDEHDAMVAFGGGMETINGLSGDDQCGVKTESDFGGVEIVVNGFGYANDVDASAREVAGNVLRAVATDHNHGFNAEAARVIHAKIGIVVDDFLAIFGGFVGEGIATIGGAEDSAAARENAAHGFLGHFLRAFGPDEAIETIADADDAHIVLIDGGANNGADDGIETWRVAAAIDNR